MLAPLAREAAKKSEVKSSNIITRSNRMRWKNVIAAFKRMNVGERTVL